LEIIYLSTYLEEGMEGEYRYGERLEEFVKGEEREREGGGGRRRVEG
jgi:hypothetical protein